MVKQKKFLAKSSYSEYNCYSWPTFLSGVITKNSSNVFCQTIVAFSDIVRYKRLIYKFESTLVGIRFNV